MAEFLLQNSGYCHCCRSQATFRSTNAWLRDHYICLNCHSIPRQRHLQHILDVHFPDWCGRILHESSPANDFLARYCKAYESSQFFPDVPPGESHNGVRCEDLEGMSLADSSIDIFVTQDVFEHINNPARAAAEVTRVLKPGGLHIFTAPRHRGLASIQPRIRIRADGEIEHLLEPQYHGSPVGDGTALVTHDYARDFERLYAEWSGNLVTTYVTRDRGLGIDGEFLEVFVACKQ